MATKLELISDVNRLLRKDNLTRDDHEAVARLFEKIDHRELFLSHVDHVNVPPSRIPGQQRDLGYVPPRDQPGGGLVEHRSNAHTAYDNDPQVRDFSDFIIRGVSPSREYRDMEAGSTGAAFVPQAFYPLLTEAKKSWGGLIEILNQKETADGAPMKIAFANDTGNLAHVLGETLPVSETDPTLFSTLLSTDQCVTDLIKISLPELQDSAFDLDKWVRDEFGKRYFRGLTSLVTNGSSTGNIASLVGGIASGACVTSLYDDGIGYDDLVALYGALDPAYIENATWVMHSTTRAALLKIKDSLGRPLYVPSPTAGAFDRLLGQKVVLNQYMDGIAPSTTSPVYQNIPIQFGDFQQGYYLRLVRPGLAIARLNERYMDTLEVGFLGYFRAGGVITDAGTHPIVNLVQAETGTFPSSD